MLKLSPAAEASGEGLGDSMRRHKGFTNNSHGQEETMRSMSFWIPVVGIGV
jgi:hypothetical protein